VSPTRSAGRAPSASPDPLTADAAAPPTLAWVFAQWTARRGGEMDLEAALQAAPDTVACLARSRLPTGNHDVERRCAAFGLDFARLLAVVWDATASVPARCGAPRRRCA
jgi:hypothetical protein